MTVSDECAYYQRRRISFGLIAAMRLDMGPNNAAVKLMVISQMTAVAIMSDIIINAIGKRLVCLLGGILIVADGDMDVVLNTTGA